VNPRIRELLSRQKRSHQKRGAEYTFDLLASDTGRLPVLDLWGLTYLAVKTVQNAGPEYFKRTSIGPFPLAGGRLGWGSTAISQQRVYNAEPVLLPPPARGRERICVLDSLDRQVGSPPQVEYWQMTLCRYEQVKCVLSAFALVTFIWRSSK
jgi:hypothetical protein